MIGAPDLASYRRLLWETVTLGGTPTVTIPAGKTESVTTYPDKVESVKANVQAMSGRGYLMGLGLEDTPTHRIWLEAGVVVDDQHLIKATSGQYAGNYYRVLFHEKFDHHIEVTARVDPDAKAADPL